MTPLLDNLPLWLWFALALAALFFARKPVHQGIFALARFFHNSLRLGARALANAEQRLRKRNCEVLLATAREATERGVEREFDRVEVTIKKELAQYPALHRKLCEQLTAIDEDYVRSAEVPPEPTNWAKAIRAVAEISAKNDPVVGDVLETIHQSMRKAESRALEAYRESARERHQLLKRMVPSWRAMLSTLGRVNKSVDSVIHRAKAIDNHMERYEELQRGDDRALRALSSSSLARFFVSFLVLAIVAAGILVNFHLITKPMGEIVGDAGHIGDFGVADIAAVAIILVQIAMGVMVMECLRITRLFPVVGALEDKQRRTVMWAALGLLFFFACMEAGLAFMREDLVLSAQPAEGSGMVAPASAAHWAIAAVHMGLGFSLPLALAFAAIPLEQFIASGRIVVGALVAFVLRLLSVFLRLAGTAFLRTGALLVCLYDIVIFLPLWLENLYINWRSGPDRTAKAEET